MIAERQTRGIFHEQDWVARYFMRSSTNRTRTLRRRIQLFLKENWIETIFGVLVVIGLLAILIQRSQIDAMQAHLVFIAQSMAAFFARFSLFDLLGALVAVAAAIFLLWRIRVRFLKSDRWLAKVCPRCGSPIARVHRSRWDKILGLTVLPHSRRYNCPSCKWSGLRHRGEHERRHHDRL